MGTFIDLKGMRFGRLVVLNKETKSPGLIKWECICDCGRKCKIRRGDLRSGRTKSCGCIHSEKLILMNSTHGLSKDRIYTTYNHMVSRCNNKNNKDYDRYGGRGISICSDWLSFESFVEWAFENGYKDTLEIDRIDNNGDYSPDNCRWVTRAENVRNSTTTKLSVAEVKEIKKLLQHGYSQRKIGVLYNVSKSCIKAISDNKTWRDI